VVSLRNVVRYDSEEGREKDVCRRVFRCLLAEAPCPENSYRVGGRARHFLTKISVPSFADPTLTQLRIEQISYSSYVAPAETCSVEFSCADLAKLYDIQLTQVYKILSKGPRLQPPPLGRPFTLSFAKK
jgi:hypothetical protein